MKRHHLRPFGFFLGYLMHLYTILNIKDTKRNQKFKYHILAHIWTYLIWELWFYVTEMKKNKSKVRFVESSFGQHSYFLHLSFMKMSISCTCLLKSIVSILKVIFLESNPLRFIETLISFIRGFVYCLYMPGIK
jgi:hypothetical protein